MTDPMRTDQLPDISGERISIEIYITYQSKKYLVEPKILTPDQKKAAKAIHCDHGVPIFLTNFLVKDAQTKKEVFNFNPPLELEFRFTYQDWKKALDKGYDHPKLVYLVWKEDGWAGPWKEFPADQISEDPPENKDDIGYLYLQISELEDPLIGGC